MAHAGKTAGKKTPTKKKAVAKKSTAKTIPPKKSAANKVAAKNPTAKNAQAAHGSAIRIRMYRVGFGDFFLLTIPAKDGPQHILIDCGVHAGNIGTMADCVADLVELTRRKLALVIVTHYHADHLSGFATQYDEFAQFEVGAVWITNRLNPSNQNAMALMEKVSALAIHLQLQLRLSARSDEEAAQAGRKVENAMGVSGGSNAKAMELVTTGFSNSPPVYYYEAGDTPKLPASLQGALTAQILGPAPFDSGTEFSASDNRAEQYIVRLSEDEFPQAQSLKPFDLRWPSDAGEYSPTAFKPWNPDQLESVLNAAQPDALAAAADAVDGTLNNQSLVVLFTCKGKKLLFVGDAQWGNWAYWLYGRGVKGQDPGISASAKKILSSLDFYKVGHHGSTNATPIPAAQIMPAKCVAMCSTETGYPNPKRVYGKIEKKTEVPRIALMEALEERTANKLVRSDWLEVADRAPASPEALAEIEKLPHNFEAGKLYIDYLFPD